MVVPMRERTHFWHRFAIRFLCLHLYLRLRGTQVSPPLLLCVPGLGKTLFPERSEFAYSRVGERMLFLFLISVLVGQEEGWLH